MVSQNINQGGGLAASTQDTNKEQYGSKQTTVASSALFDTQSARETSANDISSQKPTSTAQSRAGKLPVSPFHCITTFHLLQLMARTWFTKPNSFKMQTTAYLANSHHGWACQPLIQKTEHWARMRNKLSMRILKVFLMLTLKGLFLNYCWLPMIILLYLQLTEENIIYNRLLNRLTQALKRSGVDPSQASISVEINMDRRATEPNNIHDDLKVITAHESIPAS